MKNYCLVTILLTLLVSMPMFAYDFEQDGIYYNIEGDHVSVTYSGEGIYQGSVTIPNRVTYGGVTYPVTAIGEKAFEGGEGMTYLSIPSSITSIGEYAFRDCGSNIEVHIATLKAWCKVTFGNEHSSPLSSAKKFYLGSSEIKSLSIPDGVESIPSFAFYQCRSITSLTIPSSVKTIGSSAFEDCTGLKSIYLNEGLESIGGSSFEGCSDITSITLPSSLTSIAINAFNGCANLNVIVSKIQNPFVINENVFNTYTTALLYVPNGTISAYMATVSWNMFTNIIDETELIGQVFTTAGFSFRIGLDHTVTLVSGKGKSGAVVIPSQVTYGGKDYSVTSIGYEAFDFCINITSVVIPNTVTSISMSAFVDCVSMTSVTIPSSVRSIARSAFGACVKLASIKVVETDIKNYDSRNDCNAIIETSSNTLILGCNNTVIPNSVTSIGDRAFDNCSSLSSITIPSSVKSIAQSAFGNCYNLTSINVESGNQYYDSRNDCNAIIETLTNTLIKGCDNTIIPNSVTSIGNKAFYRCKNRTSVTVPDGVKSIGDFAFQDCSSLSDITIPNSVSYVGSKAFDGTAWYNSLPDGLIYIGKVAYKYKGEISANTQVTIKEGTSGIADYAFSGKSGLTSVTIPNSVESIGYQAFYGCRGLVYITLPCNLVSIGNYAFYDCSLTDVYCKSENVPSAGSLSFSNSGNIRLYVPSASLEEYKSTEPWNEFWTYSSLSNNYLEATEKCPTPTISIANGVITVSSGIPGVDYHWSLSSPNGTRGTSGTNSNSINLTILPVTLNVYATKSGYLNSDVATYELFPGLVGDVDGNGVVNVADHVELSKIIMGQE